MFEAKLADASLLKKIIEAIKDIVTDAVFDCSASAMCLQAMDASHVALVSLNMEVGLFESYRCDRIVQIGTNMIDMMTVLRCSGPYDSCMIKYEENNNGDNMMFCFTKNEKTQDLTVKLIEINNEQLGIPEQDYSVVCEMPSHEFKKTITDFSMFSDSVNITASKGDIIFSAKGDKVQNVVTFREDDDIENISVQFKEPVNVNFSLRYMNQFTKASSLSDRVRLSLSTDAPIMIEYSILENGYLRFYMAPKIDDDDME